MRFRLDAQHYINDRLLEPGHIIGEGTDVPMILPDGSDMQPSAQMTPLDQEAYDFFKARFPGARMPERDPTKAIPIRGSGDSAKQAPLFRADHEGRVIQPTGGGPVETVDNVPGGYVADAEGKSTGELKKGSPDSGTPNAPIGQPVIGHAPSTPTPTVQAKPEDPAFRVAVPPAEQKAVSDAQAKAQSDAGKASAPHAPTPQEVSARNEQQRKDEAARLEQAAKQQQEKK